MMLGRLSKITVCLLLTVFVLVASAFGVSAESSYNYDSWGDDIEAPAGYRLNKVFGYSKEVSLKNPTDMFCRNGLLYVLDTGNKRVVIYDKEYNVNAVIDKFYTVKNGEKQYTELLDSKGIFVTADNKIIIADTENNRVLIINNTGEILKTLTKPVTENFPKNIQYRPVKVVADDLDNIYVLAEGFYYGAIVYNSEGNYTNFFGANRVSVSVSMLAERFWRKFMSNKQKDYTVNYLPSTFVSLDIDENNFIYTVASSKSGAIRKLNSLGTNIFAPEQGPDPLDKTLYGDRKDHWLNGAKFDTVFSDITVSEEGFVYVLDKTRCRIFQYDKESNLINVFGNKGDFLGTTKEPVAIETLGKDVLVLDQEKGYICLFGLTDYGKVLNEATTLYHNGLFDEAYDMWQKVLKINSNCELAYRGIGRAYLQQGNYENAMKYAKLGQDRLGYSKSFRFYRSDIASKYFAPFAIGIAVLLVVISIIRRVIRKKNGGELPKKQSLYTVKKVILNPITFYEGIRKDKSLVSIIKSSVVILLFFVGNVVSTLSTGFIFNKNDVSNFNIFFAIAQTLGLVVVWILSEMVVGSLKFGHGTIRTVFNGTSAALIPYTISIYINLFLSQFLVYEEKSIMNIVTTVGLLYTVYLMYQSVRVIQNYNVIEAVFAMVLDVFVVVVVILLLVIIYMLVRQMLMFGTTVYQEIAFRIN